MQDTHELHETGCFLLFWEGLLGKPPVIQNQQLNFMSSRISLLNGNKQFIIIDSADRVTSDRLF